MVSVTVVLEDSIKAKLEKFAWINWSEVARLEAMKKKVFERFIKTGTLSKEDQEFCDKIDWYPIDELELREEYIKKLKSIEKGRHSRLTSKELDKLIGL